MSATWRKLVFSRHRNQREKFIYLFIPSPSADYVPPAGDKNPASARTAHPAMISSLYHLAALIPCAVIAILFMFLPACKDAPAATSSTELAADPILSPGPMVASPDGGTLYVACETAARIAVVDAATGKVRRTIPTPDAPLGLAINKDGRKLFVTCAAPQSTILVLDAASGDTLATHAAGHTAMAPVLSPDERTLYVCNRFNNEVQFLDLTTGRTTTRIAVPREPVAMDLTPDGKHLIVANHLPHGRADVEHVAAVVSIVDVEARQVAKELLLPSGSTLLRGVAVSPDGKFAAVTHLLARFHLPPTQLDRGWVQTNALTLIDIDRREILNTVLLDTVSAGAANPWAVAWSADGGRLVVTHAGTHELSVIDAREMLVRLIELRDSPGGVPPAGQGQPPRMAADIPNDLAFLAPLNRRIPLPDKGPRAVALVGSMAYASNYFADTLAMVDLDAPVASAISLPLGPPPVMDLIRQGELAWNDASLCYQGWLSCSSCHSSDARVDGLIWDNLNDGIGNPKKSKSMILSFQTPPTTALGVRENAHVSVRAGIRNILFTSQPEEVALALDAYLSNLIPMPSPHLIDGELSPAARRGRDLFMSERVGCADCHAPPLYTRMKARDVGTIGRFDKPTDKFITPTLVELWRSAPYLHDGSAATVRDVLTTRNPEDRHGNVTGLNQQEIDDLCEFLLSL
jgi:YVTN family beta-propeller protein